MTKKLLVGFISCILLAFLSWGIIFVTDSAYPQMVFRVFQSLGLLFVMFATIFLVTWWIEVIRKAQREKNYRKAVLWLFGGLLWVLLSLHAWF